MGSLNFKKIAWLVLPAYKVFDSSTELGLHEYKY